MQMVADLPEHYFGQPAFEFIKDVPVNWETTLPLDGVIGEYYIVARKDRNSEDWYIGAVTNEDKRTLTVKLNFLPEHQNYTATIYRDGPKADWKKQPEDHEIEQRQVTHTDHLKIHLAAGGGFAIRISPEGETISPYPYQ